MFCYSKHDDQFFNCLSHVLKLNIKEQGTVLGIHCNSALLSGFNTW